MKLNKTSAHAMLASIDDPNNTAPLEFNMNKKKKNINPGCAMLVMFVIIGILQLIWGAVNLYQAMNYPLESGHIVLWNHVINEFPCEDIEEFRANPEMFTVGPLAKDPQGAVLEIERVYSITCPTKNGLLNRHIHNVLLDKDKAWQVVAVLGADYPVEHGHTTYDVEAISTHLNNDCDGNFSVLSH